VRIDYYSEEKHGEVEGSAVDNDVLDSSKSILKATPFGARPGETKLVGLQQWFTPEPIARFAAAILGPSTPVLDFTAGSGAMLQHFGEEFRFGVELDPRMVEKTKANGAYNVLQADVQRAVPMMRAVDMNFYAIAINPPFGLTWSDKIHGGGSMPSVKLSYLWAQDLLARAGQGLMLCDRDDLAKNVLRTDKEGGIYAVIDLEGQVFEGVTTKTAIALFLHHENVGGYRYEGRKHFSASKDELLSLVDDITRQRQSAQKYMIHNRGFHHTSVPEVIGNDWNALKTEYARRKKLQEKGKSAIKNDLELKGKKVHVYLNPYARTLLAKKGDLTGIELLHGQPVNYFATNLRDWKKAQDAEDARLITIGDPLKKAIEAVKAQAQKTTTPLFPVRRAMRLGWLEDVHEITCTTSDPARGFEAGKTYRIATQKQVHTEKYEEPREDRKKKRKVLRQFERQRKLLHVKISNGTEVHDFDEKTTNIDYLEKHFDIPDPGDVATLYSTEYEANIALLGEIQEDIRIHHRAYHDENTPDEPYEPFAFKQFQMDHMARLLVKERGLLAHEQGLGKTLMLMTLAEAMLRKGVKPNVLFVVPQDLIPQWAREAKRFFGRTMEQIATVKKAREVQRRLEGERNNISGEWIHEPENGWFITHYETLSRVGRKYERLPEVPLLPQTRLQRDVRLFKEAKKAVSDHHVLHQIEATPKELRKKVRAEMDRLSESGADDHLIEESLLQAMIDRYAAQGKELTYNQVEKARKTPATSKWACPLCRNDSAHGWTGEVCRKEPHNGYFGCGYVHRAKRYKSGYAHLGKAFIDGVICVDELSEIRGNSSQRSQALRALARGKHKFGGTGTPLSNYVNDCFWGLWWTLGNSSLAFPYDYKGGRTKFEEDFCVVEYLLGEEGSSREGQREQKKILPMITNVSQFWRLTQPGVSRCRKEQTGEPLVPRTYHLVQVPMGLAQKQMQRFTLAHFANWFEWENPDHPMVLYQMHEKYQMGLGARWWLERTATLPTTLDQLKGVPSERHGETWPVPYARYPDGPNKGERVYPWVEDISDWTPANLKVLQIAIEHAEKGEKVLIGSDLITTGQWLSEKLAEKGVSTVHIAEDKNGKMITKAPKKRAKEVSAFTNGDAQVMCAGIAAMKLGHNMDKATTVIVHGLPDSFMMLDQFIARVHRLTSKNPVNVYVVVPEDSLAEKKWELLKDKGGTSDLAFDGELMLQQEEEVDWEEVLRQMKERGVHFDGSEVHEADVEAQWENLSYTAPKHLQAKPEKPAKPRKLHEPALAPSEPKVAQDQNGHRGPSQGLLSRLAAKEDAPTEGLARKKRTKVSETVVSLEEHEKNKAIKEGRMKAAPKKKRRASLAATGTDAMFDFTDDGTIDYAQDALF